MSPAVAAALAVRVNVLDTWETFGFPAAPDQTVGSLKAKALAASGIAPDRFASYEVKFGGAAVRDESRTMGALGVRDGSSFIVLSKRRRPVR